MHCGPSEARELALAIRNGILGSPDVVDMLVCPPFVSLAAVREILTGSAVQLGAQNVYWEEKGAWTGEVAAAMLRDAGCRWVLVGHSERRQFFGETDESVLKRLRAALAAGLRVIVCVGETLQEREAERTSEVVTRQVRSAVSALSIQNWSAVALAYEPVWAIGTGRVATPEQAQEVHHLIRGLIGDVASDSVQQAARILYGGSVKPDNAAALLAQADVDGALVGGASLKPEDFLGIIRAVSAS